MIFLKATHPLTAREISGWLAGFTDVELVCHGWSRERLAEALDKYDYVYNRQADALASLIIFHAPDADTREILFLATPPLYRQKKCMAGLLGAFLQSTRPLRIWLECREDNSSARRLYEGVGFKETGHRPRYYNDGTSAILFTY